MENISSGLLKVEEEKQAKKGGSAIYLTEIVNTAFKTKLSTWIQRSITNFIPGFRTSEKALNNKNG